MSPSLLFGTVTSEVDHFSTAFADNNDARYAGAYVQVTLPLSVLMQLVTVQLLCQHGMHLLRPLIYQILTMTTQGIFSGEFCVEYSESQPDHIAGVGINTV